MAEDDRLMLTSPEMQTFLGSTLPDFALAALTPMTKPEEFPVELELDSLGPVDSEEMVSLTESKRDELVLVTESQTLEDTEDIDIYQKSDFASPAPTQSDLNQLQADMMKLNRQLQLMKLEAACVKCPEYITHDILSKTRITLRELTQCPNLLVTACNDKHCCRYVQDLLDTDNIVIGSIKLFVQFICHPKSPLKVGDLAKHPYGNHLVQKLVELCYGRPHEYLNHQTPMNSASRNATLQLIAIGRHLMKHLLDIKSQQIVVLSTNHFSSRVVQKVLDYRCRNDIDPNHRHSCFVREAQLDILSGITSEQSSLTRTMCNPFGNYVLQKAIGALSNVACHAMFKVARGKAFDYCLNIYGCRVIQQLITRGTEADVMCLVDEIAENEENIVQLCKSNEGNYCMQKLLEYYGDHIPSILKTIRKEKYLSEVCLNKFGSHVIENCLTRPPLEERIELFRAILYSDNGLLRNMILHQYGNYQIQAMMHMCIYDKDFSHFGSSLLRTVTKSVSRREVMKHPWGYYITSKIEEMMRIYRGLIRGW